jgi:hypothetical protein
MAIAADATSNPTSTTATSLTYAHTCAGSDRLLLVAVEANNVAGNNYVTGVTYAGVSMTQIGTGLSPAAAQNRWSHFFYLFAPALGSNNVVISASNSTFLDSVAASYTGVDAGAGVNVSTTSNSGATTSRTTSVVTTLNNCWTFLSFNGFVTGGPSAGAGTFERATDTEFAGAISIFDSNGPISPAGSTSLITTTSGNIVHAHIMAAFAPAGAGGGGGPLIGGPLLRGRLISGRLAA